MLFRSAVLLVEFKIASGQGIAARHVDVGCVLGFRIVLGQGVGVQLAGEPEVVGLQKTPEEIGQAHDTAMQAAIAE